MILGKECMMVGRECVCYKEVGEKVCWQGGSMCVRFRLD